MTDTDFLRKTPDRYISFLNFVQTFGISGRYNRNFAFLVAYFGAETTKNGRNSQNRQTTRSTSISSAAFILRASKGGFSASEEEEEKSLQLMERNRPARRARGNVSDGIIKFHGESVNSRNNLAKQLQVNFNLDGHRFDSNCVD